MKDRPAVKRRLVGCLLLLLPAVVHAASHPFDLSGAATKDVIFEEGGRASPFGENPAAAHAFAERGHGDGASRAEGLPRSRKLHSNDADIGEYLLAPYDGPNVIEAGSSQDAPAVNARFEVPRRKYQKIGFVVAAVDGDASFTIKLHYTDGSAESVWWEADDWYDLGPRGNLTKAAREMDRVEAATGKVEKSAHFHLYEFILDETRGLNSARALEAITIGNDPHRWPSDQSRWGGVFAVTGVEAE